MAKQTKKPEIILVLGGARSGKSRYAQSLAEKRWSRPLYLATAEILDAEMTDRVARHRRDRGDRWQTVEEPLEVPRLLTAGAGEADGILVDCLTLWLTNVLLKEGEAAIAPRRQALVEALQHPRQDVILVSNEVGLGIVPDSELGRVFRDQAGWLNQAVAAAADTVVFVAAGLPLMLKGKKPK